jgi:hypothetical protein
MPIAPEVAAPVADCLEGPDLTPVFGTVALEIIQLPVPCCTRILSLLSKLLFAGTDTDVVRGGVPKN